MVEYPGVYALSVGRPSPFPVPVQPGVLTTSLVIDAVSSLLVVALDRPTVVELDALTAGRVDVGLDWERTSAIFTWCFSSVTGHSIVLDSPLHVGLENVTSFPNLSPDGLAPGESRTLTVVVQDETRTVRMMRLITIPTLILAHLAPLIQRQLAERRDRKCRRRHFQDLRDYNARTGTPRRAFEGAPIKAPVA